MNAKIVIAITLIALNTGLFYKSAQPAGNTPEVSAATPAAELTATTAVHIIRVRTTSPADSQLLAVNFDLLEMREGADLFVQGGDADLRELRARGFAAMIHQTLPGARMRDGAQTYYDGYRTVVEHYEHLDAVAAKFPELARVIDYGDSWRKINGVPNGHELKAICITKQREGDCGLSPDTDKPRFLIIAAMHARELSTSEVAWRWIDYLTEQYGANADVTWMLDHQEMWVVPVANPDGRQVVQLRDSEPYLHRKNGNTVDGACATSRNSTSYGGSHSGVDLNRNGTWKWELRVTASDSRCDAVYRGPGPASEPENYFLEGLAAQLFHDQRPAALSAPAPITTTGGFLTLHSFANMVLMPWSFTSSNPPNDLGMRSLGFRMAFYNGYQTGQSPEILYGTSGSTDDWTYGELGIPSYTYEVGPSSGGCAGFIPPYSCQSGFWDKNLPALLYFARSARQPYASALGPTATSLAVSTTVAASMTNASLRAVFNDNAFGAAGVARPDSQAVVAAQAFLDTPPWLGGTPITLTLADGVADSTAEAFVGTVPVTMNLTLRHMVYVRGIDANGDIGPLRAAWVDAADQNATGPVVTTAALSAGVVTTNSLITVTAAISSSVPLTVTHAELYLDTPHWLGGTPVTFTLVDGAADTGYEVFTTTLDAQLLPSGEHRLYIRGADAAGNYGPSRETTFLIWEAVTRTYLPVATR